MSNSISYTGIDNTQLGEALSHGVDHGGNPIEPFVDAEGGWPLRCCLANSAPGDRIAIIAWSPFDWDGPYREVGPIVVHASGCEGPNQTAALPPSLDQAAMVLRPYRDRRISYGDVRHIEAGQSLSVQVDEMLQLDGIEFVHGRNVTGGCYAFTARRNETP